MDQRINPTYTNLTIPNADPTTANLTLAKNTKGPVVIFMPGTDSLVIRPMSVAGVAISPTPSDINYGTNQVVLFEQGEIVVSETTYAVWNDGAGGIPSVISARK